MSLRVVPLTLKEANDFVARLHRHHKRVIGHRFSIGCEDSGVLCGVAIVGRPVARKTDQSMVAEVTRLCTNGARNACSILYAAAARAAKAMGFRRIQTFILESEPGTSLKASGWTEDGATPGKAWNWNAQRRPQLDLFGLRNDHPIGPKTRWKKELL